MNVIRRACLAGLLLPAVAQAQVVNGDFAAGPANWTWEEGADFGFYSCLEDLHGFNASTAQTPSIGTFPASGRVADLIAPATSSTGSQTLCRKITQTVHVPQGTRLRLDVKFGDTYPSTFHGIVEDADLAISLDGDDLFNGLTGRGLHGTSVDGYCSDDCPKFETYSDDVAKHWGQTVTLSLLAWTEHTPGITWSTPVWVDNLAFEPAPLPYVPRLKSPSVSGNNHSISWDDTRDTSHYVLEQSIDNAAWTQVYSGPNLGWTMMSAPSGNYRYRVKACGNGCSAFSGEASVNVPQATPDALAGTVVGRSFEMTWGVSSGASRYVLEQKGEDGLWVTAYDGAATQSTLYNIAPGIYGYRVKACGASVCSGYSTEVYVTAVDVTPILIRYQFN